MTYQLQQASSVFARQYNRAVRLKALVNLLQELAEEKIVSAAEELKSNATISAKGDWLDLLAKRFGLERPFKASGDAFFFGFDGNPQSTPFNQAPFRPDGDTLAGKIPVGDTLFLSLLKATTGTLRMNGQQDSVNQILAEAYPGSYVTDGQDMTMTAYLQLAVLDDNLQIVLQKKGNIPKPAGVLLNVELVDAFGFDGVGANFDNAPFAPEE